MSTDVVFCLIYLLFIICVIYPPEECTSSGLTIESVFSKFLGNEMEHFITYHIYRTCLTFLIYSMLPLGFILGLMIFGEENGIKMLMLSDNILTSLFVTAADILPFLALYQIYSYGPTWSNHPIVINLKKFCVGEDWKSTAAEICAECRSIDKVSFRTNPVCKVIATENWIVKVTPLNIFLAHQSDASLVVKESDTHSLSHLNSGVTQFITIEVGSRRGDSFKLRLNAMDFRDFQDRIARTIAISPEVRFHRSLIDKFLDAFKETVQENVTYRNEQFIENCIGCMQNMSNVKIQKLCDNNAGDNRCTSCSCKPLWCVDCMGRWFAHKQDMDKVHRWLSEKCTCPMCRATFCVLDVSLVESD